MSKDEISFNDLPQVVSQIYSKLERLEQVIETSNQRPIPKENNHILLNTDEVCEFLKMPKPTLYAKLADGSIPAIKQGKRYYLYKDELLKWLETGRKNPCALTAEEKQKEILAGHKRKGKPLNL